VIGWLLQELETLRLAEGDSYAELIRHDMLRRSLLLVPHQVA
jgi:hypothetical protein